MSERCKHELPIYERDVFVESPNGDPIVDTVREYACATCLGDNTPVPDPFEGVSVEELDPERDLGGER